MHEQNSIIDNGLSVGPAYSHIDNPSIRCSIVEFMKKLERDGKICPKPWAWARFFNLYHPRYEPCWLSSWWQTSREEKQDLFQKQLVYLAYRTDRFQAAIAFLENLADKDWLLGRQSIPVKPAYDNLAR